MMIAGRRVGVKGAMRRRWGSDGDHARDAHGAPAKGGIVRYGGMGTYLRLRLLFFGLILGEFSQAVLWATISGIWRTPAPFFPRP